MDNGIYVALSRQLALFRDMEVTANNIANLSTTGYNANKMMFTSYLFKDNNARGNVAFAHDVSMYRDTGYGTTTVTGNTLDVALNGEGYFTVDTPLGTRYTRAGNFQMDANGTLTTPEGYAVLDQNGQRITFSEEDRNIVIGSAGNISVDGEERATLSVVMFDNPQKMERRGDRMYATTEQPRPVENPHVAQGALEQSNVQPVREVTHMIDVSRSVGSTAKFIEVMYDLQRKSASTWTQQS